MVAAALVLLCSCPPSAGLPVWLLPPAAVTIVGREVSTATGCLVGPLTSFCALVQIAMSALREYAAGQGPAVHNVPTAPMALLNLFGTF